MTIDDNQDSGVTANETTETNTTDNNDSGTLLQQAAQTEGTPAVADENAWLPGKFHVKQADGTLDESASVRKLAESYKALEAHKGAIPQAPESPDGYIIEGPKDAEGKPLDGIDMAQFMADPMFKEIALDAHAKGVSNETMQFFMDKYFSIAPQLIAADVALSVSEASAELSKVWTSEQIFKANASKAWQAVQAYGAEADDVPGSRSRLNAKFGNDPDFMALMATIGQEMKEDKLPAALSISSDMDVESLQKSPAYWNKNDPEHTRVKQQVDAFYMRKFGAGKR